ncbi:MAG: hypothetical protein EBR22_02375 [Cytophagia bacterium]|nr:hypothetical protein [Cytophagia bacterium]
MKLTAPTLLRSSVSRSRVSAFVSQGLVLFLLGLMGIIAVQARWWVEYLHENVEIQVFLRQEAQTAEIRELLQTIRRMPEVKQCRYVSREEAAREMSKELGEDFVDFLGENPLLASVKVRVHYRFGEKVAFEDLKRKLAVLPLVSDVAYPVRLLDSLQRNFGTMAWILLGLSVALFGLTWLLIDQSVRLVLFADRHLIRSMQLVGADDRFIRQPYLRRALTWSLMAWAGACVLLLAAMLWVLQWAPDLHYPGSEVQSLALAGGLLGFSLLTGWLSHYVALNKYLRLESDQLH